VRGDEALDVRPGSRHGFFDGRDVEDEFGCRGHAPQHGELFEGGVERRGEHENLGAGAELFECGCRFVEHVALERTAQLRWIRIPADQPRAQRFRAQRNRSADEAGAGDRDPEALTQRP
jgi:hypothetical protein